MMNSLSFYLVANFNTPDMNSKELHVNIFSMRYRIDETISRRDLYSASNWKYQREGWRDEKEITLLSYFVQIKVITKLFQSKSSTKSSQLTFSLTLINDRIFANKHETLLYLSYASYQWTFLMKMLIRLIWVNST